MGLELSHRKATVAQMAENLHAGYDRKVLEHKVHHRIGLRSCRPISVSTWTILKASTEGMGASELDHAVMEELGRMNPIFFYITWMAECACIACVHGKRSPIYHMATRDEHPYILMGNLD